MAGILRKLWNKLCCCVPNSSVNVNDSSNSGECDSLASFREAIREDQRREREQLLGLPTST